MIKAVFLIHLRRDTMSIYFVIIGMLLGVLCSMIKNSIFRWKQYKYLEVLLQDFNWQYERFEEYLNTDATWEDMLNLTELGVEEAIKEEAISIFIGKDDFCIKNAKDLRHLFMEFGVAILKLEELVTSLYDEIEYDETYTKFRERLVIIRSYAMSKGEELST